MKKHIPVIFAITLLSFSTSLLGQDIIDVMSQEACECLTKKDFMNINDQQKMTSTAGLCIMEVYLRHQEEANKAFEMTELNGETGRMMGEKIGVKMVAICPDYVLKMGKDSKDKEDEPESYALSGKITSMEEGDFIFYQLKEKEGKTHRLFWYQHFNGSDDFIAEPKKLVGKTVTVKVKDVECYIPKAKSYYSVKEIVELEIK